MASGWPDTEKAIDNGGDAQYGWEAAAEQMQNWQQWGTNSEQCSHYLQLSDVVDSEENVICWVDTIEGLMDATSYFSSAEIEVVGIDCEWKPNYVRGQDPNQVSILQIATGKKVLIFDLIGLYEREPNVLDTCLKVVFHSPSILKLGYGFRQDLEQLFESYTDLECFHFCDGILDLQKLYGPKGGLSGLAKTLLGSELNKERRMSNWERRPLTHSQLHYAALDAAVLVAIFNVVRCEASSHGSSGTQDTSHWKSLVTCCTTSATHKRNPGVLPEADLAGAAVGELADNQVSRITREQSVSVSVTDSKSESMVTSGSDDLRRNSGTTGPRSVGENWQLQPKPVLQETSSKARAVGRLGPAKGCWNCGGDHYMNKCPNNPDTTTKTTARIYAAVDRCEADNQASPVGLKGTTSTPRTLFGHPGP
ncbi:hypothetical protein SUGI_0122780 [Cryptomeria japonica]|nr:hypothetical protein SUGI_0122780 [Cryptomeria japonica]